MAISHVLKLALHGITCNTSKKMKAISTNLKRPNFYQQSTLIYCLDFYLGGTLIFSYPIVTGKSCWHNSFFHLCCTALIVAGHHSFLHYCCKALQLFAPLLQGITASCTFFARNYGFLHGTGTTALCIIVAGRQSCWHYCCS